MKDDFFFGKVSVNQTNMMPGIKVGESYLALNRVTESCQKINPKFFTAQLNRLLQESNGKLVLTDGTSHPRFWEFISMLEWHAVGYLRVYARNDINEAVGVTLACDIMLEHGLVTVLPHWTAYKDIRTDEIVSTLLVPLFLTGFCEKTYLQGVTGEECKMLNSADLIGGEGYVFQQALKDTLAVAQYPNLKGYDDGDNGDMERHVRDLKLAFQVSLKNLSPAKAMECLHDLRQQAARQAARGVAVN